MLCILLPTGLLGGISCWLVYNIIKENRMEDVAQIAEVRHQETRAWLDETNTRGKVLLNSLVKSCRYGDAGINACAADKLKQFAESNHAVGLTFHSGLNIDLSVGSDAIPFAEFSQAFRPGQIAATSVSKVNATPLLSLISADAASGFSVLITYSGERLQDIFVGSSSLGQSGETFLSDNRGYFITKQRYSSQQGFSKPISTTDAILFA